MSSKSKRILVFCPGDQVTGGPELLHQLVHELRNMQKDAAICYYPSNEIFETPQPYRCYNIIQRPFSDEPGQVIVLPEVGTKYLRNIQNSTPYIWWLSVDNFFGNLGNGLISDIVEYFYTFLWRGRSTIKSMRHITHLAQSKYALDFLKRHGLPAHLLTDYLTDEHMTNRLISTPRKDIIAFNPKKGMVINDRLCDLLPNLTFVPIQNMSKSEVAALLSSAKIYMDFGHHPGKDRMPREAAMAGCCVITGRRGAAANVDDVPILERYKLPDSSQKLPEIFDSLANEIFINFEEHYECFDRYRSVIKAEPENFRKQVREIFG